MLHVKLFWDLNVIFWRWCDFAQCLTEQMDTVVSSVKKKNDDKGILNRELKLSTNTWEEPSEAHARSLQRTHLMYPGIPWAWWVRHYQMINATLMIHPAQELLYQCHTGSTVKVRVLAKEELLRLIQRRLLYHGHIGRWEKERQMLGFLFRKLSLKIKKMKKYFSDREHCKGEPLGRMRRSRNQMLCSKHVVVIKLAMPARSLDRTKEDTYDLS